MELCGDIWLQGDTLYPQALPFPPLVLRSLKVTSAWLQLQTSPWHFIAELYIWTAPANAPARHTPCTLYSGLIQLPPPTSPASSPPSSLFTTAIPISFLSSRICTHTHTHRPVGKSLEHRFHFIQIKYCTKYCTHQMHIVWGLLREAQWKSMCRLLVK